VAVSRHADTPRTGHDSHIRISYPIHHSRGRELSRATYTPFWNPGAPGRIRTRDPLLRRHTLTVARRRWVQPDRLFSCTDTGWKWPGVAQYLSPLAPQLAPRNPANFHPGAPKREPVSSGAPASLANCDIWATQARDYPRPKAATPGRYPPTLSTAAPGPPSSLPVPDWPRAARRARRLHSTAR
jgi:hypothetical protein